LERGDGKRELWSWKRGFDDRDVVLDIVEGEHAGTLGSSREERERDLRGISGMLEDVLTRSVYRLVDLPQLLLTLHEPTLPPSQVSRVYFGSLQGLALMSCFLFITVTVHIF
jgi:hypothetical protein